MIKALTLSGSIRNGSCNRLLQKDLSERLRARGADVTELDLADYPLPMYNFDLETDHLPEEALAISELFAEADIVFMTTPDYNGSIPPLLKNVIYWLSRTPARPFGHAVFGVGGIAASRLSAVPALNHLRDILIHLGALIVPVDIRIGPLAGVFSDTGELVNEISVQRANIVCDEMMRLGAK